MKKLNWITIRQGINKKIISPILRKNKKSQCNLSIISNNCLAGVLYHDNNLPFASPTINLFFEAEDYITFCENIRYYMNVELVSNNSSESYPIGNLEGIKIHFLHYHSFEEAKLSWEKRKQRIKWDHLVFVMTNQNGVNDLIVERFMKLPEPKILITERKYGEYKNQILIPMTEKEREENKNPLDTQFLFYGLSGKRRYEKWYNLQSMIDTANK